MCSELTEVAKSITLRVLIVYITHHKQVHYIIRYRIDSIPFVVREDEKTLNSYSESEDYSGLDID